jgi:hypothetical protein
MRQQSLLGLGAVEGGDRDAAFRTDQTIVGMAKPLDAFAAPGTV